MTYWIDTINGKCFDIRTSRNAYAGMMIDKGDHYRVFFDSNGSRGSVRKFPTAQAAIEYIHNRREKRGLNK